MKWQLYIIFIVVSWSFEIFAGRFAAKEIKVVVLGDSLTEGYGLSKEQAYPTLLQNKLEQNGYSHVKIINGGISGSTAASSISRLHWYLKSKPQILLLALGANDGLRGLNLQETKKHLVEVIRLAKQHGLKVMLAGMKLPPNYGKDYANKFEKMFKDIAKTENVVLIPFLLEGVGGIPKYNQQDGIHPNAEGHKIMAETVYQYLKPLL